MNGVRAFIFDPNPDLGCALDISSRYQRWIACRDTSALAHYDSAGAALSTIGWMPQESLISDCIMNATVPGTILTNLIRNGTFGFFDRSATEQVLLLTTFVIC